MQSLKKERKIGVMKQGLSGNIEVYYALLDTAEGGMSPRLVKEVKKVPEKELIF